MKRRILLILALYLIFSAHLSLVSAQGCFARTVVNRTQTPAIAREIPAIKFHDFFSSVMELRGLERQRFYDEREPLVQRILTDYGALFLADEGVFPPAVCIFEDANEVDVYQKQFETDTAEIAGARIELQKTALRKLLAARLEAQSAGLDITPRDGAEAGRRNYADTVRLWNSRFLPALKYWYQRGMIDAKTYQELPLLPTRRQVAAVIELEKRGLYFSSGFSKSILYSVAPPGTSQHLAMLAFDANEHADPRIRRILARHGWFRTIRTDAAHFTFLNLDEKKLPVRGLKMLKVDTGEYWIPNI